MLTTCAEDFVTWADVYPPGEELIDGVRVTRFASECREGALVPSALRLAARRSVPGLAHRRRALGGSAGPGGPGADRGGRRGGGWRCLDLLPLPLLSDRPGHRPGGDADRPASCRPRRAGPPAAGVPPGVRRGHGLVFQTESERDLVQRLFPVASHRQLLLGLGVDDPEALADATSPPTPGWDRCRPIPICCASGGWIGTRDPICSPPCSRATRSAIPAHSGWSSPARWSTPRPTMPTSTCWARCRIRRNGRSSAGPRPWCPRRPGRRSPWWWPRRGVPGPRCWSTRPVRPRRSTAGGRGAGWPSEASPTSRPW